MLTLKQVIVESNDDLEIWSSITVWESSQKELVVQLDFIDYDNRERDRKTCATLDRNETTLLAHRLHLDTEALPSVLFERYGDTSNSAVPSEVEALFQEILHYLLDQGSHYHITQE